jgi:hypothetical protein
MGTNVVGQVDPTQPVSHVFELPCVNIHVLNTGADEKHKRKESAIQALLLTSLEKMRTPRMILFLYIYIFIYVSLTSASRGSLPCWFRTIRMRRL